MAESRTAKIQRMKEEVSILARLAEGCADTSKFQHHLAPREAQLLCEAIAMLAASRGMELMLLLAEREGA